MDPDTPLPRRAYTLEQVAEMLQEPVASASAQLGHSSEQITSRHYIQKTHEAPDMTQLLQAFGGNQP